MKTGRYLALILRVGLYFPLVGQALKKDTTFLFKDTVDGELQTIFIDPNPNSEAYEEIANFSFDYFDQLKAAKKDQPVAKSVLPWTNWVTLKQYKGNFYVYRPCDFLYHFRQSFYDSTVMKWYGDGPDLFKILTQKKRNSKTYEFKMRGIELVRKLTVHILDKKRGIALFEQTNTSHAGMR